jgi:hypothetical protein
LVDILVGFARRSIGSCVEYFAHSDQSNSYTADRYGHCMQAKMLDFDSNLDIWEEVALPKQLLKR